MIYMYYIFAKESLKIWEEKPEGQTLHYLIDKQTRSTNTTISNRQNKTQWQTMAHKTVHMKL